MVARSRLRPALMGAALVALLVALAAGAWMWTVPRHEPFEQFTITQATNTGRAVVAAISPDSKFIFDAQRDANGQSLWLRNIETGSHTQVVAPQPVVYGSVAYSPDGNHVYSRLAIGGISNVFNLQRAPVLGGTPQQLVHDIDSNVTFSPNGDRIAFARANSPKAGVMSLHMSAADGSNVQVLLTEPMISGYYSAPAWSPDGRYIVYAAPRAADRVGELVVFELASQQKRVLFSTREMVLQDLTWSSDQRRVLLLYGSRGDGFSRWQIGGVSYPEGVFRTITNDTNHYATLQFSAAAASLVSVVSKTTTTIEVRNSAPAESDPRAPPIIESREAIRGFTWTRGGRILYARGARLLERAADGGERVVLESEANSPLANPAICAGTGQVIFDWSYRNGSSSRDLWRLDPDGGEPAQLTDVPMAQSPVCSPDGQWVIFISPNGVHRVRTSGGAVESLDSTVVYSTTAWSPDSKAIAWVAGIRTPTALLRKIVVLWPGTPRRQLLDADPEALRDIAFSPDGSAIRYLARKGGVIQQYIQPLDGSPPRVVTASNDDVGAKVSPDGSQIAVLQTRTDSDVVLLRDSAATRRVGASR